MKVQGVLDIKNRGNILWKLNALGKIPDNGTLVTVDIVGKLYPSILIMMI